MSEAREQTSSGTMHVPGWQDRLGSWIERHPRFWLRLGDWETGFLRDQVEQVTIDRPIYVTGLARSGSTILLELLARQSEVVSHRYRDFPVVPVPWAWNWFVDRAGGRFGSRKSWMNRSCASPPAKAR